MNKAQHRHRRRPGRRFPLRRVIGVVGILVGVFGIGAVVAEAEPLPGVSAAGSNALLGLNGWLLGAGTTVLILLGVLTLLGGVAYLFSTQARELIRLTESPPEARGWARYLLPPLLIATVAMGVSLGDEAGRGAREPIEQVVRQAGADLQQVGVLLPHRDALPFNYSAISSDLLASAPPSAIPIRLHLGAAENPRLHVNPSSAAIVTVPDGIWQSVGAGTSALSVVTTGQLADAGDTITVEGHPLPVGRTFDWFPGLDRTSVVLSEQAYAEIGGVADPYSVVLLLDSEAKQWGANIARVPTVVASLSDWLDRYDSFWRRSVSPLSMEYLLCLLIVGAVASGFIRASDILRRRRQLAVQHILGVTRRTLIAAEYMRAVLDTAVATVVAAPLAVGLIAITNSSQYGVSVAVTPAAIGAGAFLLGCSMILSVSAAAGMLLRMDAVNEVR